MGGNFHKTFDANSGGARIVSSWRELISDRGGDRDIVDVRIAGVPRVVARRNGGVWDRDPRFGWTIPLATLEAGDSGFAEIVTFEAGVQSATGIVLAPSDNAVAGIDLAIFDEHDEGIRGVRRLRAVEFVFSVTGPTIAINGHEIAVGIVAAPDHAYAGQYAALSAKHDGAGWNYWRKYNIGAGNVTNKYGASTIPTAGAGFFRVVNTEFDAASGRFTASAGVAHPDVTPFEAIAVAIGATNLSRGPDEPVLVQFQVARPTGGDPISVTVTSVRAVRDSDPT